MKRLALFAAVVALAGCAKKDAATTDTTTAMAPAMTPPMDSTMMKDSIAKADSMKRADSMRMADSMKMKKPPAK